MAMANATSTGGICEMAMLTTAPRLSAHQFFALVVRPPSPAVEPEPHKSTFARDTSSRASLYHAQLASEAGSQQGRRRDNDLLSL